MKIKPCRLAEFKDIIINPPLEFEGHQILLGVLQKEDWKYNIAVYSLKHKLWIMDTGVYGIAYLKCFYDVWCTIPKPIPIPELTTQEKQIKKLFAKVDELEKKINNL